MERRSTDGVRVRVGEERCVVVGEQARRHPRRYGDDEDTRGPQSPHCLSHSSPLGHYLPTHVIIAINYSTLVVQTEQLVRSVYVCLSRKYLLD